MSGCVVLGLVAFCAAVLQESAADEPPRATAVLSTESSGFLPEGTPAEVKYLLAYKFQPGQFVHYSGTTRLQYVHQFEDPTGNGVKTFTSLQHNEMGRHFRVVTVDEQGNFLIEPVMDHAKMMAQMPDKEPVVFDSKIKGPVPSEFRSIHESLGHAKARFLIAPSGELLKSTIIDNSAPASLRDSAEKLNTRFEFVIRLPRAVVKVGDSWKENYTTIAMGRNGTKQPIDIRRIYKLDSVSDQVAHIKFKTVLLSSLNDPELEKQVMQQTPQGSVEFDIEAGLVRSYVSSINQTTVNAFGPKTVLQIIGESTEKLVPATSTTTASAK